MVKSLKEQIEVMEWFLNDGKIELKKKDNPSNEWEEIKYPNWDWAHFDYRIKEEPKPTKEVFEWIYSTSDGKWWIDNKLRTEDEAKNIAKHYKYTKTGRSFIVECE